MFQINLRLLFVGVTYFAVALDSTPFCSGYRSGKHIPRQPQELIGELPNVALPIPDFAATILDFVCSNQ